MKKRNKQKMIETSCEVTFETKGKIKNITVLETNIARVFFNINRRSHELKNLLVYLLLNTL